MDRPYIEDKAFEKTNFSETPLERGDYELCTFSSCDFSNAKLADIRFIDCVFNACNLSNADLTKTSFNYSIDPESNYIRGAKFSLPSVAGLLNKYDIEIQ